LKSTGRATSFCGHDPTSRPGIIIGRKGAKSRSSRPRSRRRPSAKCSSTFRKCTSRSSMPSWCRNRLPLQLGKARGIPARHAQGCRFGALRFGCKGTQGSRVGPAEAALKSPCSRMVSAGAASAAYSARRYRLRHHRSTYHLPGVIGVKAWLYKGRKFWKAGSGRLRRMASPAAMTGGPGARDRDRDRPRRQGRRSSHAPVVRAEDRGDRPAPAADMALAKPAVRCRRPPAECAAARTGGPIMPPLMPPRNGMERTCQATGTTESGTEPEAAAPGVETCAGR